MSEEAKYVETARADRSLWLMKCPTVVSRAWQEAAAAAAAQGPYAGGDNPNPNPVVAKVILSLDPLGDDDAPSQASLLLLLPLTTSPRCVLLFRALRFDRFVLDLYFNLDRTVGTDGIGESNTPPSYLILFVEVQRIEHVNLFDFSIDRRAFDFVSRNNR
ncbi:hypothetical protein C2845_PM07G24520 [Panicum miliaceum]|uniref:TFIIF beta subunit N-terminal domain-containing protein n=1 Tax=Panicum miliaceum TaxID=4540 RepID=A0A3L6SMY4_PANMI|nr:hypothetical protein C2845_PM07G24520 [Panicum miliaceum]